MRALFPRQTMVALCRFANLVYFAMTATYCLLSYSPFASAQFLKAHLIVWLTNFGTFNAYWFCLALLATALTIVAEPETTPGRPIAWAYLGASAVAAAVMLTHSVLPQVENNGRGLVFTFVALVPPVWLAWFDHAATSRRFAPRPSSAARALAAGLLAGLIVWAEQSALVPFRVGGAGDITLTPRAVAYGALLSAADHLVVFGVAAVALFVIIRAARGAGEYWLLAGVTAAAVAGVVGRLVFSTIAFTGRPAWMVAAAFAVAVTLSWSGVARRRAEERFGADATAMEVWLAAVPGAGSRQICGLVLLALCAASFYATRAVAPLDWDFLMQRLVVVALWAAAFAYSFFALRRAARVPRPLLAAAAAGCAVLLFFRLGDARLGAWSGDSRFVPEFAREGYAAVEPSFRVADAILRQPSRDDGEFYAYLRANTVLQHVDVQPVSVDFESPIGPPSTPTPDVFLFIIDSMRRDYVSAYNPAVRFTPSIGRFASENVTFTRAFTRYGGTGFSVPAIWAGGMLLHKQYVKPFAPMNALSKLLDADGYRRVMSIDVIARELFPPDPATIELDRGREEFEFDFCRTSAELRDVLASGRAGAQPVFGYTLAENIHISHVRNRAVPPGRDYGAFEPHVASGIEAIDGCFGRFIDFLRESGRYDNSIVILTSDHGDSLGEGSRWGHSYNMFPEISRVPLMIHLPSRLAGQFHADPDSLAMSTDITPTLYELLGHDPADLGPLFGTPLFRRTGEDRGRGPMVAVSSYGAVYAVYRDNGTRLYIADGVNQHDYLYDVSRTVPVRIGVAPDERAEDRKEIRARIAELSALYHYHPDTSP